MNSAVASVPRIATRRSSRVAVQLGAAIAAVAAVQALLAAAVSSPWIFPDELIYSELAKNIAAGHLPAVRGVTSFSYGIAYPALISPAWLFGNAATAYAAVHVVNAVMMPIAAIPAYLLARRFVGERSATVVAVASILVPGMTYTSSLLVENALYPAFLFALLAMIRSYERATPTRQLVALVAIAFAFEVKALALVLVPAHLCSIWLAGGRAARRRYLPTALVIAGTVGVAAALVTIRSGSPTHVVGAYSAVLSHVDPTAIPWWFLLHLAELGVAVAWIPLVATILLVSRQANETARAFARLAVPVVVWTLLAVAAVATWPGAGPAGLPPTTARIYERSTFFLLPLLLIGFAIWIEGRQRPVGRRDIAIAAAAAMLPVVLPISDLRSRANFQAPALVPWLSLGVVRMWWVVFALVLGAASLLVLLRPTPRTPRLAWMLVCAWFVLTSVFMHASTMNEARVTSSFGAAAKRDWIDATVGRNARVAIVWREPGRGINPPEDRQRVVWINEFFNRSAGAVYVIGGQMPYGLPTTRAVVRPGGLTTVSGDRLRSGYVLAACDLGVAAPVVAVERKTRVALYRTAGAIRISSTRRSGCD